MDNFQGKLLFFTSNTYSKHTFKCHVCDFTAALKTQYSHLSYKNANNGNSALVLI